MVNLELKIEDEMVLYFIALTIEAEILLLFGQKIAAQSVLKRPNY